MSDQVKTASEEVLVKGSPASPGYALGEVFCYIKNRPVIGRKSIKKSMAADHLKRFRHARIAATDELELLSENEPDPDTCDIINAQIEIVNDPDLNKRVKQLIEKELCSVSFAIHKVFDIFLELLSDSENILTKERSVDLSDIRDRLIQLATDQHSLLNIDEERVIVAEELSPREVIRFAGKNLKGIVMDRGGSSSHAAIIARSVGIPAVVGTKTVSKIAKTDDLIALDGNSGTVVINPSSDTVGEYERKTAEQKKAEADLQAVCEKQSVTKDGFRFTLRANIEFVEELKAVKKVRAEGIGLLRTESVYLDREHFEDYKKQKLFYRSIMEGLDDGAVTIRLFDAGGDKFFKMGGTEKNPFLGWRGIRMLLDNPNLLREQLRAILSVAGLYPGRVQILVPMVSAIDEVLELKKQVKTVQEELAQSGHRIDEKIPVGIMVEVPSVAIMAGEFAKHVDFFSIGTNDLTQYTLAVDRGNELISDLFNQRHPAVWSMIKVIARAAQEQQIEVALCGELASDPYAAACLLGMGVNDLSMTPASIPRVKKELLDLNLKQMKSLAEAVLQCTTVQDVDELFKNINTD